MNSEKKRIRNIALLTIAIIGMAGAGFLFKLYEFVQSLDDTAAMGFAIVPLASYFLTGAGFLMLLVWSATRGAFKDVEAPKYRMMELEQDYAREEGDPDPIWKSDLVAKGER